MHPRVKRNQRPDNINGEINTQNPPPANDTTSDQGFQNSLSSDTHSVRDDNISAGRPRASTLPSLISSSLDFPTSESVLQKDIDLSDRLSFHNNSVSSLEGDDYDSEDFADEDYTDVEDRDLKHENDPDDSRSLDEDTEGHGEPDEFEEFDYGSSALIDEEDEEEDEEDDYADDYDDEFDFNQDYDESMTKEKLPNSLEPPYHLNKDNYRSFFSNETNSSEFSIPSSSTTTIDMPSVNNNNPALGNTLSGLSEEDDSDIEEDLEQAVRQIKLKPPTPSRGSTGTLPLEASDSASSRPPSANTSPWTNNATSSTASLASNRRKHGNSASSKKSLRGQQSLEVISQGEITNPSTTSSALHFSSTLKSNNGSVRRTSAPAKSTYNTPNSQQTQSSSKKLTPDPLLPSSTTNGTTPAVSRRRRGTDPPTRRSNHQTTPTTTQTHSHKHSNSKDIYTDEKLAAQVKLEIGLGLRDPNNPESQNVSSTTQNSATNNDNRSTTQTSNQNNSHPAHPVRKHRSNSTFVVKKMPVSAVNDKPKSSFLSSQIQEKMDTFNDPLEEYVAASGKSEQRPLILKMYMPSCKEPKKPWEIAVRKDVTVSNAIGFALYCYAQEKREPPLPEDMCNANKWTLRIIEEDGEPDEDFPALDRTRLISAYSFDEFALVEATPAQIIENENITPSTRRPAKSSNKTDTIVSHEDSNEIETPQKAVLKIYKYPYDDMVSQLYWSAEVDLNVTIGEVLYQVCLDKELDRTQYVLKLVNKRSILPMNSKFSSIEQLDNFEITPKRVVNSLNGFKEGPEDLKSVAGETIVPLPSTSPVSTNPLHGSANSSAMSSANNRSSVYFRRSSGTFYHRTSSDTVASRPSFSSNSSSVPSGAALVTNNGLKDPGANSRKHLRASIVPLPNPELLTPSVALGFQKYKIWRRQPMSFISRHERVLTIDGEYIHIIPAEDRAWYDSLKMSSFHISQMTKCKISRKIPTNFKVVIIKNSGTKRYDLEAPSAALASEIVTKLKHLYEQYNATRSTTSTSYNSNGTGMGGSSKKNKGGGAQKLNNTTSPSATTATLMPTATITNTTVPGPQIKNLMSINPNTKMTTTTTHNPMLLHGISRFANATTNGRLKPSGSSSNISRNANPNNGPSLTTKGGVTGNIG